MPNPKVQFLITETQGFAQETTKAMLHFNFNLSYGTATGNEAANLSNPAGTGTRWNDTTKTWEPGSSLAAGNALAYTHTVYYVNLDPVANIANFTIGPATKCVEQWGLTKVPLAAHTISTVVVNCSP